MSVNTNDSTRGLWSDDYEKKVLEILRRPLTGKKEDRDVYHIKNSFAIVSIAGLDRIERKSSGKLMITQGRVQDVLQATHQATGHAGEKKTYAKLRESYDNIPLMAECERCQEKRKRKETVSGTVVRPVLVSDLHQRGQVDLVDMQSMKDGSFAFILHYQEHLSKFHLLRPLQTKSKGTSPVVDCSAYVDEGSSLVCPCEPPRTDVSSKISWPGYSDSSKLKIENVSRDDNGRNFTCRMVMNGQTTEEVYTLHVAYGPSSNITITGPSVFVTNGSRRLILICEAGDVNPPPIYSWIGVTCDNSSNQNSCSFTPQPLRDDGKAVSCRATNPSGREVMSASANFTLRFSYPPSAPPVIERQSSGQYLRSGDNLTCTVTGGKPLVSKISFSCTSPENPDGSDDISDVSVTSSLTIDTSLASGADTNCTCSGLWEPEAELYFATTDATFQLEYKTTIVNFTANDQNHSATVDEKTQVVFKCIAPGRPAPNLMLVTPSSKVHSVSNGQELLHTDDSISCEEAGTYVCIAANGFPDPDSQSLQLHVRCGLDAEIPTKFYIIGGGVSGGLLMAIVIGIIIRCSRYRRYERPPPRREGEEEENPYTSLRVRPRSLIRDSQQHESFELAQAAQVDNNDDSEDNPYDEVHTRPPGARAGVFARTKRKGRKKQHRSVIVSVFAGCRDAVCGNGNTDTAIQD
ncbi:hypothetical protein BaRGS_00035666 [Batillaria attramentaria]|uniref:Ig-like domain-containing protein n=1 Tax=Batillaria attramentaria TaxID=370345 RepID=A0ABD0JDZ1_9CAEN